MQQQRAEIANGKAGFNLNLRLRRADRALSFLFSAKRNLRKAQQIRNSVYKKSQHSPNSAHFISTKHNTARFHLFASLPLKECLKLPISKRQREERKAKIILKYGLRYQTLSPYRKAESLRILEGNSQAEIRKAEYAKFRALLKCEADSTMKPTE